MDAVLAAQMSKLYYTKSIVTAAIIRSQIRSHDRLFSDAVLGGYESSERLCGRLKRDGRVDLCEAARCWYKNALAESMTWSLSEKQQRLLRDAWLYRRGTASELCRRIGGPPGVAWCIPGPDGAEQSKRPRDRRSSKARMLLEMIFSSRSRPSNAKCRPGPG